MNRRSLENHAPPPMEYYGSTGSEEHELGGTSEIVYDDSGHGPIDTAFDNLDSRSVSYQYTGMNPYVGGPEAAMGFQYTGPGQSLGGSQYFGGAPPETNPQMFQNPEVYMLRSKILELSRSLAVEIESHKQTEARSNEYVTQLKRSAQILEGVEIKEKHKEEQSDIERKVKDMEDQIKDLKNRVYDGEIIEEKLREELSSIKRNANHDSDENLNLRDKINDLNRKIDESTRLLNEKDDQIDRKNGEIASLKRQLGNQIDTTDQIKTAEQRQNETIRELELKASKTKMEADKYEYRIQDLNDKVNDLYKDIDRANEEIQSLTSELRKKTNESDGLRDEVRSLNRDVSDLEKRESVLVLDLERKNNEINHLKHLLSNGVQLPQEYYNTMNAAKSRNTQKTHVAVPVPLPYDDYEPIKKSQKIREDPEEGYKVRRLQGRGTGDTDLREQRGGGFNEERIGGGNTRNSNQRFDFAKEGRAGEKKSNSPPRQGFAPRYDVNKRKPADQNALLKEPEVRESITGAKLRPGVENHMKGNVNLDSKMNSKEEEIRIIEGNLMNLQLEKEKLDKELRKLEDSRRTKASMERMREVENELGILSGTITKAKNKLRQLSALKKT